MLQKNICLFNLLHGVSEKQYASTKHADADGLLIYDLSKLGFW